MTQDRYEEIRKIILKKQSNKFKDITKDELMDIAYFLFNAQIYTENVVHTMARSGFNEQRFAQEYVSEWLGNLKTE